MATPLRKIPEGIEETTVHDDAVEGKLTPFLGWFSIGLGLAELAAPDAVARLIGAPNTGTTRLVLRICGAREIASGVGILSRQKRRPAGWLWSRVGGDAVDLALLGTALTADGAKTGRLLSATAAVAGVTVLDVLSSTEMTRRASSGEPLTLRKSVTIQSTPGELYAFWRDLENLPRFMDHLESVTTTTDGRSHWVARAPAGTSVEWDAEIVEDEPGRLISWRSLEGADVDNAGSVRFEEAPGGRGTVVSVEIEYTPPGGMLGSAVAELFGEEPEQQVSDDLRRLKQVIETGEVVRSDSSIHAMPYPAQPSAPANKEESR